IWRRCKGQNFSRQRAVFAVVVIGYARVILYAIPTIWPAWKKRRRGKQLDVCFWHSWFLWARIYLPVDFGSEAVAFADRNRQEDVAAAFCCRILRKSQGIFLADGGIFALALRRTVFDKFWITHHVNSFALQRGAQTSEEHR